ncbi:MAG: urea transporter [Paludibacteraceae bacterium]|nr:urea transporter [Paludibacteraceae bacterium]
MRMKDIRQSYLIPFYKGVVLSYASIFFSQSLWFGWGVMLVSFLYPVQGLCGFLSCLVANLMALFLLKDRQGVASGLYGFNSVFVGLAVGLFAPFNWLLLFAVSFFSFLLSVGMEALCNRLRLPFLAFPFLFCLWTLLLMIQQKGEIVDYVTFMEGESTGVLAFLPFLSDGAWSFLPSFFILFFKSLGLILFQPNVCCGVVLFVLLLCFSRIFGSFSLLGFAFAYLLYGMFDFEVYGIPYLFYGFNFILTTMAVGCYYLIPSKSSYVWALLLIPVQYVVIVASSRFFSFFFLPSFSFPFCILTLLFLAVLGRRKQGSSPTLVYYRGRNPESTLYYYEQGKTWQFDSYPFNIGLPFMGTWRVYQGIQGEHTHKGVWSHAWDFVLEDERNSQYRAVGDLLTDYYCYRKPVVAAAAGVVVALQDGIEDNRLGEVNAIQNWGNYVVLKHADGLYSAVCHLEKGSIVHKVGDGVEKGEILALCGNSGYSPFPHLHFQFQSVPQMGVPTLDYRISAYMKEGQLELLGQPKKGELVSNIQLDDSLPFCYSFHLGDEVKVVSDLYGEEKWSVKSDDFGGIYFSEERSKAQAWFVHDGRSFRFLRYEGGRQCALYHFFLSNYHVPFIRSGSFVDSMPLAVMKRGVLKLLQDFLSPIHLFVKMPYEVSVEGGSVQSRCSVHLFGRALSTARYETVFRKQGILEIKVEEENNFWKILFMK